MRLKSLSVAIGLSLVSALTFTLQAEDAYSKHCAPPSTYTNLTPGTWKGTFEQTPEMGAHDWVGQQYWLGAGEHFRDAIDDAGEQLLSATGLQGQEAAPVRLLDAALELSLIHI